METWIGIAVTVLVVAVPLFGGWLAKLNRDLAKIEEHNTSTAAALLANTAEHKQMWESHTADVSDLRTTERGIDRRLTRVETILDMRGFSTVHKSKGFDADDTNTG